MKGPSQRRSRHLKSNGREEAESTQPGETATLENLWERGTNTNGLPILPDELLLEILSYFPPIPLPTIYDDNANTETHTARRDMAEALSRTCSNLWRFFHPYVWERIEVCDGVPVGKSHLCYDQYDKESKKAFALELVRQLEMVTIRDIRLAQHVHVVNVEISDFSIHSLLLELSRCFSLFLNLHTVKLNMLVRSTTDTAAVRAFQKQKFPQIRCTILSPAAYSLLVACPNVRTFQSMLDTQDPENVHFVRYLKLSPTIEHLHFGFIPGILKEIVKHLPNLLGISISFPFWDIAEYIIDEFDAFISFEKLQAIKFEVRGCSMDYEETIVHLKSTLLARRDNSVKRIITQTCPDDFSWVPQVFRETITILPVLRGPPGA